MAEPKSISMATFFRDVTTFGGALFYVLLVIAAGLFRADALFWRLVWGFLITMVVVVGIRMVYFKDRPAKQKYHNFLERLDASSFPSWHMARAIFLALLFGVEQPWLIQGFFLLVALGVGYSRIYLRKHDYWDVLAGLILGVVAGWLM